MIFPATYSAKAFAASFAEGNNTQYKHSITDNTSPALAPIVVEFLSISLVTALYENCSFSSRLDTLSSTTTTVIIFVREAGYIFLSGFFSNKTKPELSSIAYTELPNNSFSYLAHTLLLAIFGKQTISSDKQNNNIIGIILLHIFFTNIIISF